jgi:hypothetical protein
VLDTGGRAATTTFIQNRIGDVLVTFENEAEMIAREFGRGSFEVVYPSVTAVAELPVSVVDKVVDKQGTRKEAEAYLAYLWSDEGQRIAASNYLRPRNPDHGLEPKDLAEVCEGKRPGDKEAAIKAFDKMGEVAGDAMATAVTLIDGLIVIGGGVMNNYRYLMPGILRTMRGKMHQLNGDELNRVQMKVYNLDDPAEFEQFARGEARSLKVYGSDREVVYDPQKRVGVMRSKIGASKAISLGAYAFALTELDK